jgi:hypothetical protein
MSTTFLKRQKEMKRLEKQRAKAERRAQKKLASHARIDHSPQNASHIESDVAGTNAAMPTESERQN